MTNKKKEGLELKRLKWKENNIVNIRLKENLYTIAQMSYEECFMMFFIIHNEDGIWENIDLKEVKSLFCLPVLNDFLRKKVIDKLENVMPTKIDLPKYWIYPYPYPGRADCLFRGGRLVEAYVNEYGHYSNFGGKVVKDNLTKEHDIEIINKYELTSLWDDKSITNRLIEFYETGVNRDILKIKTFDLE